MFLPLTIGLSSDNKILRVDLKELPHLFISYSEPIHLQLYLRETLVNLSSVESEHVQLYLSLNRENFHFLKDVIPANTKKEILVKLEPELSTINARDVFMKSLNKLLLDRIKKKDRFHNPVVVIADDIFDLIISRKKNTGHYFLQMLKLGHFYGFYFIGSTIRTYRNLMAQLQQEGDRCAELIINPEYFFYFKTKDESNYTCYYPLKEVSSIV